MTPTDAIQAGGVLAFAGLVLYILRELRPVLTGLRVDLGALKDEFFELRITFAALLERDRIRDQRRKRDSDAPHLRVVPRDEFDQDDTTDIVKLIEKQREVAKDRGMRSPRPGTHHDGER